MSKNDLIVTKNIKYDKYLKNKKVSKNKKIKEQLINR